MPPKKAARTDSQTVASEHGGRRQMTPEAVVAQHEGLLAAAGAHPLRTKCFLDQIRGLQKGVSTIVPEDDLVNVSSSVDNFTNNVPRPSPEEAQDIFRKLVVVKLNGGLGTAMGLTDPKATIEVRDGKTLYDVFSDQMEIARKRAKGTPIRVLFMNSFVSAAPTRSFVLDRPQLLRNCLGLKDGDPTPDREAAARLFTDRCDLRQGMVPKIDPETFAPIATAAPATSSSSGSGGCGQNINSASDADDDAAAAATRHDHKWCPPGHGDFWLSLVASGTLKRLIDEGKEYLFISNMDNQAATVDERFPHKMMTEDIDFLLEACQRSPIDVKGSHLARHKDGTLIVRDSSQCSAEDKRRFYDVQRHPFFNTNSLWVKLSALQAAVERSPDGFLRLPLVINRKCLNPTDPATPTVLQLETPVAAAIMHFPNSARFVRVPRSRFSPIKHTSDLFAVRSDAYEFNESGGLAALPQLFAPPQVKLDSLYSQYAYFAKSIGAGAMPSLKHCHQLIITGGPVAFAKGVTLQGRVVVEVKSNVETRATMCLPPGTYCDEEVVL